MCSFILDIFRKYKYVNIYIVLFELNKITQPLLNKSQFCIQIIYNQIIIVATGGRGIFKGRLLLVGCWYPSPKQFQTYPGSKRTIRVKRLVRSFAQTDRNIHKQIDIMLLLYKDCSVAEPGAVEPPYFAGAGAVIFVKKRLRFRTR